MTENANPELFDLVDPSRYWMSCCRVMSWQCACVCV